MSTIIFLISSFLKKKDGKVSIFVASLLQAAILMSTQL